MGLGRPVVRVHLIGTRDKVVVFVVVGLLVPVLLDQGEDSLDLLPPLLDSVATQETENRIKGGDLVHKILIHETF